MSVYRSVTEELYSIYLSQREAGFTIIEIMDGMGLKKGTLLNIIKENNPNFDTHRGAEQITHDEVVTVINQGCLVVKDIRKYIDPNTACSYIAQVLKDVDRYNPDVQNYHEMFANAKSYYQEGFSVEDISRLTGLHPNTIEDVSMNKAELIRKYKARIVSLIHGKYSDVAIAAILMIDRVIVDDVKEKYFR